MKVIMLQEDIEEGQRQSADCCPVAIAISRAVGVDKAAMVSVHMILICLPDRHVNLKTPKLVTEFVHNYDHGFPVKPITFELEI